MEAARTTPLAPGRERLDRLLRPLHIFCASIWLLGASGPMSVVEFAPIPLGLCFFARAIVCRRLWLAPIKTPLFALLGLWAGWQAVSLLWSPDPRQGLDEMDVLRFAWSIWMLYPVLDHRRTLILVYACGLLCGNAAQVLHVLAPDAIWHRQPGRFSGWWEPVAGGIILCSALGLHLPAAMGAQGKARLFAAFGAAATAVGILLTGTRGAWLAGAALFTLVSLWTLRRIGLPSPRTLAAIAVVAVSATAALWLVAGDSLQTRTRSAISEIRSAWNGGGPGAFDSDTGARLLMNAWAVRAFAAHPIGGVGAGGYRAWILENINTDGIDPSRIHDHAHSVPLHIAAVTGAVGLLLTGSIVAVALYRANGMGISADAGRRDAGAAAPPASARTDARTPVDRTPRPGDWSLYEWAPFWALVGVLLVSATNTLHISAQPFAHLMILFSLCPPRPRPPRQRHVQ